MTQNAALKHMIYSDKNGNKPINDCVLISCLALREEKKKYVLKPRLNK